MKKPRLREIDDLLKDTQLRVGKLMFQHGSRAPHCLHEVPLPAPLILPLSPLEADSQAAGPPPHHCVCLGHLITPPGDPSSEMLPCGFGMRFPGGLMQGREKSTQGEDQVKHRLFLRSKWSASNHAGKKPQGGGSFEKLL